MTVRVGSDMPSEFEGEMSTRDLTDYGWRERFTGRFCRSPWRERGVRQRVEMNEPRPELEPW